MPRITSSFLVSSTRAHTHSSDKYSIKMSMMDGVTTGLDMELGAINSAAWYEREEGKWPMNFGQCVGYEMARMIVHDGMKIYLRGNHSK